MLDAIAIFFCVFSLFASSYAILEYSRRITVKKIIFNFACVSFIQSIWTISYMLNLYTYIAPPIVPAVLYFILSYIMFLIFNNGRWKIGYWLITNFIIPPVIGYGWIRIDDSPFQRFLGGVGIFFTPMAIMIVNSGVQLAIWLFVKPKKDGSVRKNKN